jgi:hypothetical protein
MKVRKIEHSQPSWIHIIYFELEGALLCLGRSHEQQEEKQLLSTV